jgi:uncharacterized protein YndB with AHSA1/START domain
MQTAAASQQLTLLMEWEITIAAPPVRVWHALVQEVNSWWSHSFTDNPRIVLEPRIGGRFCEEFDDQGNGALFATVTFCQPPSKLKYIGTMGMQGPVLNQSTWDLSAVEGGTRLRKAMEVFGQVPPVVAEGYNKGSVELLGQLKDWIEAGKAVR